MSSGCACVLCRGFVPGGLELPGIELTTAFGSADLSNRRLQQRNPSQNNLNVVSQGRPSGCKPNWKLSVNGFCVFVPLLSDKALFLNTGSVG